MGNRLVRGALLTPPNRMAAAPAEWHPRYIEQARWTAEIRSRLLTVAGIDSAARILEIGCGTGAVLAAVGRAHAVRLFGVDRDPFGLVHARREVPEAALSAGDASALPFSSAAFDIIYTHYLFLWLADPSAALAEMRRVVRPGGAVVSLAEPDYGARVDYPNRLADSGHRQRDALIRQGADVMIGRRMGALMAKAGLHVQETGILGARWSFPANESAPADELDVLFRDAGETYNPEQWMKLTEEYEAAGKSGARVQFVPTFYALALRKD